MQQVTAEILRIVSSNGTFGESKYAITNVLSEDLFGESVTFSLDKNSNVWSDGAIPKTGEWVTLSDLRRNNRGWRAHIARYYRPSDETKTSH